MDGAMRLPSVHSSLPSTSARSRVDIRSDRRGVRPLHLAVSVGLLSITPGVALARSPMAAPAGARRRRGPRHRGRSPEQHRHRAAATNDHAAGAPLAARTRPACSSGRRCTSRGNSVCLGPGRRRPTMDVQARQAMDGVGAVLKAAGLGYEHLVKCHVYLANMDDYAAMNAAYGSYFTDRVPARTTVQVGGATVERRRRDGVHRATRILLAFRSCARPPGRCPLRSGRTRPAVWAGDTLYLSGMGGQDPATKTVGDGGRVQVTQTVANVTTTLKAAGLGAGRRRVGAGVRHAEVTRRRASASSLTARARSQGARWIRRRGAWWWCRGCRARFAPS